MVRSLRELFVDDLDLLLEHLAGVHTVVARVSRASLQADTAASTDLLDRFFQLRAEHVPQLDRLSTINHQLSGTTRLLLQAARRAHPPGIRCNSPRRESHRLEQGRALERCEANIAFHLRQQNYCP